LIASGGIYSLHARVGNSLRKFLTSLSVSRRSFALHAAILGWQREGLIAQPADVDAVVAFLASDQRLIIGDIIHFDGAQSFDRSALSH
jgi:hypothetical protein